MSSPQFEAVLTALQPTLEPWFTAVALDHQPFLVTGWLFFPLYDKHFPDIISGEWPTSAPDPEAFSPILEMLNGFIWRLWCDRMLTTATPMNRKFLNSYLLIGESAITPTTYFGAAIPGRFCPDYAYHFQIDGWPTDPANATTPGFLAAFEHLPLVLWQAKQHGRIKINLHQPVDPALPPLQTREEHSSATHRAQTPAYSVVPPAPATALPQPPLQHCYHHCIPLNLIDNPVPSRVLPQPRRHPDALRCRRVSSRSHRHPLGPRLLLPRNLHCPPAADWIWTNPRSHCVRLLHHRPAIIR
jgi:hypothetical protein